MHLNARLGLRLDRDCGVVGMSGGTKRWKRVGIGLLGIGFGLLVSAPSVSALATGAIERFAAGGNGDGGPAIGALLDPAGAALDAAGNLYFADTLGNRVRRIDAATGIISNVAGTGVPGFAGDGAAATNAWLKSPSDVALDSAGNVYIADRGNHRVRRVDAATKLITTVAGNGINGFAGDGGAATAARLNKPNSVAIGPSNVLYIADTDNQRVRRVLGGTITTYAGNGTASFCGDGGLAKNACLHLPWHIATDASGNLYIADFSNFRVRKVDTASSPHISTFAGNGEWASSGDGGPATQASFRNIVGVAVDAQNNRLLIADAASSVVRAATLNGSLVVTVAGTGSEGYSGDGGPADRAMIASPRGLAASATQGFFLGDTGNGRIRRVNPAHTISTYAGNGGLEFGGDGGPAELAMADAPTSVATDAAGNVYIADTFNNRIRRVGLNGIITTIAGNGTLGFGGDGGSALNAALSGPKGVDIDAQGDVFISDTGNNRVRRIDSRGIITTFATILRPTGLAFDAQGYLYVAEPPTQRIKRISPSGQVTDFAGNGNAWFSGDGGPATQASLSQPADVDVDANGDVYIADLANDRVRVVRKSNGFIYTFAGGGAKSVIPGQDDGGPATAAKLDNPSSVSIDAFGSVFFVDQANLRVRVVDATGTIYTAIGNGILTWSGDGPGGDLTDDIGDGGPANAATFTRPECVAIDGDGNAFVSDSGTNNVRWVYNISSLYAPGGGSTGAVSGRISYYSNDIAVPAVSVRLAGPQTQTVTTSASGGYAANELGSGNWSVVPSKLGGGGSTAVSPLDASYVLQAVAGLRTFNGDQNLACDVTGNGTLSTLDASLILQRALGMSTEFDAASTCGSDWLFVPVPASAQNQSTTDPRLSTGACTMGEISFNPLAGQPDGQDFLGILLGDCTGNWGTGGAAAALSAAALSAPASTEVAVVLGPARRRGNRVRVPVSIRGDGSFRALQLSLRYDSERLLLRRVRKLGAAADAMLLARLDVPGAAGIALASPEAIDLPARHMLMLEFTAFERDAGNAIASVAAAIDEQDVPVRFPRRRPR
jgi:sugar lactone lactonase YvrE